MVKSYELQATEPVSPAGRFIGRIVCKVGSRETRVSVHEAARKLVGQLERAANGTKEERLNRSTDTGDPLRNQVVLIHSLLLVVQQHLCAQVRVHFVHYRSLFAHVLRSMRVQFGALATLCARP